MQSCIGALTLITLFGSITETESRPIRYRRSRCETNPERRPDVVEPQDEEQVIWSSDGLVGSKYFESNGKQYIEVQELVPATGGKYHIVKKVVEATPSLTPLPALTQDNTQRQSPDGDYEVWYEPPGQKSYPKLLFSPRYGWREMNAEEVRRLEKILPIAKYDALTHRVKNVHIQDREAIPKPHQGQRQFTEHQNIKKSTYHESQHPEYKPPKKHTNPHVHHLGTLADDEAEKYGKMMISKEDPLYYQPQSRDAFVASGGNRAPGEYNQNLKGPNIARIFQDRPWQQAYHLEHGKDTPRANGKSFAKVKKFSRLRNDLEVLENAVQVDVQDERNWYNKDNGTVYSNLHYTHESHKGDDYGAKKKQMKKEMTTATEDSGMKLGYSSRNPPESEQYVLQKSNTTTIVCLDGDDCLKGIKGDSDATKEDKPGSFAHSEAKKPRRDGRCKIQFSNDGQSEGRNHRRVVSVEDIRRHQRRMIQLPNHPEIHQCDDMVITKRRSDFWLLRTHPCKGEKSEEGRILLPNGEVLRFYGHPQIVTV